MPNSKINRLNELNKLWFRLHAPKKGDKVKFKIRGQNEIYDGEITTVEKHGNSFKYQMVSRGTGTAPAGMRDIVIIECNGIKFEELTNPYSEDNKNFKPI